MVVNLAEKGDVNTKLKQQKRKAESWQGGAVHCSEGRHKGAMPRGGQMTRGAGSWCGPVRASGNPVHPRPSSPPQYHAVSLPNLHWTGTFLNSFGLPFIFPTTPSTCTPADASVLGPKAAPCSPPVSVRPGGKADSFWDACLLASLSQVAGGDVPTNPM